MFLLVIDNDKSFSFMFEFMSFEQLFLLFLTFCCRFTLQFLLLQNQDCLCLAFDFFIVIRSFYFLQLHLDLWQQKSRILFSVQCKVTSNFIFQLQSFCSLIINLLTSLPIFLKNFWLINFVKGQFEFTIFIFLTFPVHSLKLLS